MLNKNLTNMRDPKSFFVLTASLCREMLYHTTPRKSQEPDWSNNLSPIKHTHRNIWIYRVLPWREEHRSRACFWEFGFGEEFLRRYRTKQKLRTTLLLEDSDTERLREFDSEEEREKWPPIRTDSELTRLESVWLGNACFFAFSGLTLF